MCISTIICQPFSLCLYEEPTMKVLHDIVIPRISSSWSIVADYLEYKLEDKKLIKAKFPNDPMKCCVELLEDWLSSNRGVSPKSWSSLIKALKQIKDLAGITEKIVQDLAKAGVII